MEIALKTNLLESHLDFPFLPFERLLIRFCFADLDFPLFPGLGFLNLGFEVVFSLGLGVCGGFAFGVTLV